MIVDAAETINEVRGYQKQDSGFGYVGVLRGSITGRRLKILRQRIASFGPGTLGVLQLLGGPRRRVDFLFCSSRSCGIRGRFCGWFRCLHLVRQEMPRRWARAETGVS